MIARSATHCVAAIRSARFGSCTSRPIAQELVASYSQSRIPRARPHVHRRAGDITIHALPQLDVELLPSVLVRARRGSLRAHRSERRSRVRVAYASRRVTLRTTYTFTPRTTLQLYGQCSARAWRIAIRVHTCDRSRSPGRQSRSEAAADDDTSTTGDRECEHRVSLGMAARPTLYAVYSRSQGADRTFGSIDDAPIPWSRPAGREHQVFLVKLSYFWWPEP